MSASESREPTATSSISTLEVQNLQVEMARTRTLLALDRTLLAWIRTSLALLGFGFTLARFVHDLIASKALPSLPHTVQSPKQLGLTLMVLGICGLLFGSFDHWNSVKQLRGDVKISAWSASLVVALFLAMLSLFLMFDLTAVK
jgi:putative membrane protein